MALTTLKRKTDCAVHNLLYADYNHGTLKIAISTFITFVVRFAEIYRRGLCCFQCLRVILILKTKNGLLKLKGSKAVNC